MSKLRNRRTSLSRTAVAVTGAAALLALLTACNGTASGSVSADGGSAAPAAGDSTTASGSTGGTTGGSGSGTASGTGTGSTSGSSGSSGSSGTSGSSGSSTSGGSSASGGSVPACQASQLGYSWADSGSGTGQQKHAVVALTNKSGHSCTMYGFPGVDLVNSGRQWSLQRTNATPKRVTLANGAAADFPITFLESDETDAFNPTTVVITAPNQRSSFDLPWHGGPVLLQDGATHPGTFVGPVGS
ncbi:DUF4232 domain-containing protein [Streptomyces fuscichromogenes]|uniref:DUF4232 domain-containing protein n=1 Tax=Streptomyces fuscichromogenes TaxID=1324013 RepID=UPI00382407C8